MKSFIQGRKGRAMRRAIHRTRGTRSTVKIPRSLKPLLQTIGRHAAHRHVEAYVVGGCVRDWRLGLSSTADVDITVEGDGIALARDVAAAMDGHINVHEQFGTATVVGRGLRIDFASARRETYAKPAAYPRVSAGTIADDLLRRDFTINAMAVAIHPAHFGTLLDPFHGAEDLRRKRLRVLHPRSFQDDPSRILRGVRFAQRFNLQWEPTTRALLRAAIRTGVLGQLNMGRLRKELDLMLEEPNPRRCLQQLATLLDPAPGA